MELGVYTFAELTPESSDGPIVSAERRLRDLIEEIELADQVGLDVFGVGEHHRPDFAVSAPGGRARRGGRADRAHPPHQRRHGAQLRRPGARLPGLRHARPALRRPRRDHGRPRLVHRVLPALRLRPRRLRRAVRREARAAAGAARRDRGHLAGPPPRADRRPRRLPAAAAGPAAGLGRGRRHAAVGGPRRRARPADGAGDHRRRTGPLRAVRRAPPRRRPRPAATRRRRSASTRTASSPRLAGGRRHRLPGLRRDDGPDRPRARLAADDPRRVRSEPRAARRQLRRHPAARWPRRSSSSTRSSATTAS